jgi:hypothetical protein
MLYTIDWLMIGFIVSMGTVIGCLIRYAGIPTKLYWLTFSSITSLILIWTILFNLFLR